MVLVVELMRVWRSKLEIYNGGEDGCGSRGRW